MLASYIMNFWMANLNRNILKRVAQAEAEVFNARTAKSSTMLKRAAGSMIKGVPMPWMYGLYRHHSLYVTHGEGPRFYDIDGNNYLDFNVVDLAVTMGFNNPHVQSAVAKGMERGTHFLLPIEEAVEVSEELSRRTGVPVWQFTLSASGANTEVIRISRAMTKRNKILVFEGHYHGHIDDTMFEKTDGEVHPYVLGLPPSARQGLEIISFNDLQALEEKLKTNEIALVITEPALSNCTLVLPEPDYLESVQALCRRYGTLFCLDEAHNFSFAYGGLTREWGLRADFLVLGKGLGTGIPFGMYGMSRDVADYVEEHTQIDLGEPGIAAGGTTYANTLSILCAKAALERVLTPQNYAHTHALGLQLATGLRKIFAELDLDWTALHLGPRVGYCMRPQPPKNGAQGYESIDIEFISARKLFMANRGIWDAMATAGPQVSFVHTMDDVTRYLGEANQFMHQVCD